MKSSFSATVCLIISSLCAVLLTATGASLASLEPDALTGTAVAVVVEDVPLVHTSQALPCDAAGKLVGTDDVARQTRQALANIERELRRAGASLESVAKLNLYVSRDEAVPAVQAVLAKTFSGPLKPAVTFVTGALAEPGVLVTLDAVAASSTKSVSVTHLKAEAPDVDGIACAAVLPAGPKLYVSGMADSDTLLPATRKTLEKLVAAIGHLGSRPEDIAQLKIFLQPMSAVAGVRQEVSRFFGGQAPPTVFVEWISANPVVEIELIAAARVAAEPATNSVSFFTPPGTTDSKVYRRVARVDQGKLIFVSGLYGPKNATGAEQIRDIFNRLRVVAERAGSDLQHLVKATYYVTDNDASQQLNALRPNYYDPLRPPAASKAMVRGVGWSGNTVTLDMIAVTK